VITDTDLELVRALHPAAGNLEAGGRERARDKLLAAVSRPPRRSRRRRRSLPALGSVAVAATAVAVIVVFGVGLHSRASSQSSAASRLLARAALTARAGGGPGPMKHGEYWYVHSLDVTLGAQFHGGGHRVLQIQDAYAVSDRQVWIGYGVAGQLATRPVGTAIFLSARARAEWERAGRPRQLNVPGNSSLPVNAFDLPYRRLQTLPTRVGALWLVIKRMAGRGSQAWQRHEMFTMIGDILREDPVPAPVRAALYEVAARIPGIDVTGPTHDGAGRPALAVTLNDAFDGSREELLFSPRTAKLLGEQDVVVKPPAAFHVKPGTVTYATTYLSSGIVKRAGHRPAGTTGVQTPVSIGQPAPKRGSR
jgi:hypothetical protein